MTEKETKEATVTKKSIHRIQLAPGRMIEPNTIFACPVSQVKWLTENGAITSPKNVTAADASARATSPVEKAETNEEPLIELDDLDEMDDAALRAVANELGIKAGKKKRASLLKLIKAAQVDEDDPEGLV